MLLPEIFLISMFVLNEGCFTMKNITQDEGEAQDEESEEVPQGEDEQRERPLRYFSFFRPFALV